MITVVSGLVGHGKSYDVVRMMAEHIAAGGIVATNIRLKLDKIRRNFACRADERQFYLVDPETDPRTIPRGDFRGHGRRRVLVVLDEALNWFASAATTRDPRRETWGEWLRQSDKLGQDVFFVAQEFNRSAKWIRELAQVLRNITCLGKVYLWGVPVLGFLGFHKVYSAVDWDIKSRSRMMIRFGMYRPRVYQCYDTSDTFGFSASANAYDASPVFPRHEVPRWFFALPFVALFFVLLRTFVP